MVSVIDQYVNGQYWVSVASSSVILTSGTNPRRLVHFLFKGLVTALNTHNKHKTYHYMPIDSTGNMPFGIRIIYTDIYFNTLILPTKTNYKNKDKNRSKNKNDK